MISNEKISRILKLTAEAFSGSPQSDMLDFFFKQRKKGLPGGPREGWVQCEIVRKLGSVFDVDVKNVKAKDCDFVVDNIGIELKVSATFRHETLFDGIRAHRNADCWMFVTKYDDERERTMKEVLSGEFPNLDISGLEMIPKTNPNWCVVVVTEKRKLGP